MYSMLFYRFIFGLIIQDEFIYSQWTIFLWNYFFGRMDCRKISLFLLLVLFNFGSVVVFTILKNRKIIN